MTVFENESQEKRAASMLKQDLNNKYDVNKLINFNSVSDSGEILFISTGVTSGEFIEGVKVNDGKIITNTVCIYRDATGNVFNRKINTIRNEKKYFNM